jgi:ParB family chromosome partitioning protein
MFCGTIINKKTEELKNMAGKGLGRGLGSLFGDAEQEFDNASAPRRSKDFTHENAAEHENTDGAMRIPIGKLFANPNQPRKHFDVDVLKELAASIMEHGIIQPIVVNQSGDRYMIIAGERRWRAAQMVGLDLIPAIVRNYGEKEIKEISLIENLQREDLNAIDAATAIQKLMEEHRYTQETVSTRIGKSRPYIANLLRLLDLCQETRDLVSENRLSAGHARTLVVVKDVLLQAELAAAAADGKMSVRDLEKAVKQSIKGLKKGVAPFPIQKPQPSGSVELRELKNIMQRIFSTKVEILGNDNKGCIRIDYYSRDDIDRIAEIMDNLKQ